MENPDRLPACICHRREWVAVQRTINIRKRGRTIMWWQCSACEEWGLPVAVSPEEDDDYYTRQKETRTK